MPHKKTTMKTETAQLKDPAKYINEDPENPEDPDKEDKTKPQSGTGRDPDDDGEGGGGGAGGGGGTPSEESSDEEDGDDFALTPGLAHHGTINYRSKLGRSIYLNATAKLEEELYDCDPEGFYQFIQSLKTHAAEYGWDDEDSGVLMIPC